MKARYLALSPSKGVGLLRLISFGVLSSTISSSESDDSGSSGSSGSSGLSPSFGVDWFVGSLSTSIGLDGSSGSLFPWGSSGSSVLGCSVPGSFSGVQATYPVGARVSLFSRCGQGWRVHTTNFLFELSVWE